MPIQSDRANRSSEWARRNLTGSGSRRGLQSERLRLSLRAEGRAQSDYYLLAVDQGYHCGAQRPTPGSLIHHSDRGVQYAFLAYRQRLADPDITVIMSRPGNPFRLRPEASLIKTLKAEEINGKAFIDVADSRRRIDSFVAEISNEERLNSVLGSRSPLSSKSRSTLILLLAQTYRTHPATAPRLGCFWRQADRA